MTKKQLVKKIEELTDKLIAMKKIDKTTATRQAAHHYGYKKIVSFIVNGKERTSGQVEEILGTRNLQRYRDNPGKEFKVGKLTITTKVYDKSTFKSRPRHSL